MKRLTFFLKGNVDVHDSLHSCRIGGKLVWNGINDVLRTSYPDYLVRLKHETSPRSDALLQCDGIVPDELSSRQLPLDPYPAAGQFSRAVFDTEADVFVLSIQADVVGKLMRHRKKGFLLLPRNFQKWSVTDREWLRAEFEPTGLLELPQSMANLGLIIAKIRQQSESPILIYNMSPIVPGETIHCYQGMTEAYATRIRRFNLGLIELSEKTGISIIDVDSLLARKGADLLKLDIEHLTAEGYRLVTEEVVRVLEDLGIFAENED